MLSVYAAFNVVIYVFTALTGQTKGVKLFGATMVAAGLLALVLGEV